MTRPTGVISHRKLSQVTNENPKSRRGRVDTQGFTQWREVFGFRGQISPSFDESFYSISCLAKEDVRVFLQTLLLKG